MQPRQLAGIGVRKSREQLLPHLPVDFDRRYERKVPRDPCVQRDALVENTAVLHNCLDAETQKQFRKRARDAANGTPTFLDRTLQITNENALSGRQVTNGETDSGENTSGGPISWYDDRFEEFPLLWALKLYAFQPLGWTVLGFDTEDDGTNQLQSSFDGWIRDWAAAIEIGRQGYLRRAWTPWAVSLRILNWSRYLVWREQKDVSEANSRFDRLLRRELYKNALFLRNHIEWDVGGNHLIENGAALVVAGILFGEQTWVEHGKSILVHAADEQFLDDGAHFERSPMYHVLTLTRFLTVCDLLERSRRPVPEELWETTHRATRFLQFLRPPDGRIPLLNDAVYGQALPLDCCLRYADTLGFGERVRHADGGRSSDDGLLMSNESETDRPFTDNGMSARNSTDGRTAGYQWLRTRAGALLFDGGPVGPPHLPGHSHSDTLSILLWLDGLPVVTDTGTFGYVSGCQRDDARGVRGHNTIQVGDIEPVALGGKYLMGPRPEPRTRRKTGTVSLVEGQYEAAPYSGPRYTHHRAVYAGTDWWLLWDTVGGHDGRAVRNRLHLHPSIEVSLDARGAVQLELDEVDRQNRQEKNDRQSRQEKDDRQGNQNGQSRAASIYPLAGTRPSVTTGPYFPRFGVARTRRVVELHAEKTGSETTTAGLLVTGRDLDRVTVETGPDGRTPRYLQTTDGNHTLPEFVKKFD